MVSDGSPILIDLLDSLSSINKRLNLIETALSAQGSDDGLDLSSIGAGSGTWTVTQPAYMLQPQPVDKSPQAVAQRYGQPPPPPYQPYAHSQSASPSVSISPLPTTNYTSNSSSHSNNNGISHNSLGHLNTATATSTSAGWPGAQPTYTSHAAAAAAATATAATTTEKQRKAYVYAKRPSQLLRLKNVHAKDMMSDDGTDYEVDTSDGDVHMRNSRDREEGDAFGADEMDIEPTVKQEKHKDVALEAPAHGYGEQNPASGTSLPEQQQQQQQQQQQLGISPPISEEARLEALPEGFIVTGRATLQEELDSWTIPRGYSMRINGTRSHGRRQKIRMVCFRGGRSRLRPKDEEQEEERQRQEEKELQKEAAAAQKSQNAQIGGGPPVSPVALMSRRRKPTTDRVSKKCECPFRFELVEVRPGADEYAVHYTNDDHMQHNHAAADLMLDPRARKLPAALKAEVDQWLRGGCGPSSTKSGCPETDSKTGKNKEKAWTIAKIQAELQKRGYGHVLDFDLRNRKRALLHKERVAQQKNKQSGARGESSKATSAGSVGESSASNTPTAG